MRNVNPKILGAFAVGFLMVAGTLYLSVHSQEESVIAKANNEPVTKHPTYRSFIPVDDENNDGVPDWQEYFVGAEINLDEISTSTPYEPTTLTGQVAAELGSYILNSDLNEEAFADSGFIDEIVAQLDAENVDIPYTANNVVILSEDTLAARRHYGNRVVEISEANAVAGEVENELVIWRRAMIADNPETLEKLDPIIAGYQGMIDDMLTEPVPASLVEEHLALINIYQSLQNDIVAFRYTYEDALSSVLRHKHYLENVEAMREALSDLYVKLHEEGIRWTSEDAVPLLISISEI